MLNEEGKRLGMFIERVCKLSQRAFADEISTAEIRWAPSHINKYINGGLLIPLDLLKILHRRWLLNYEWFFEGTGSLQVDQLNRRSINHDLTDILASVAVIESSMVQVRRDIKQLSRDLYSIKHEVKE